MTSLPAIPGRTLAALQVAVVACAAMALGSAASAQLVPKEMPAPVRGLEVANNQGKQIPGSLQFTNTDGQLVSLGTFFNRPTIGTGKQGAKPIVVQMMYFRCPILCPTVLNKFTSTLQQIDFTVGKDFDALIVSIDPRDTPKDAQVQQSTQVIAYNRPGGDIVRNGWNFVTSSADSARALADALGFPYRYLPDSGEYAHGAAIFILTPDGKLSRTLTGLNYPASDVRLALLEASGGKIGTVFDAFTLWCYHYDPSTGTYTLAAMRVMRTGGALTVALIGLLLAFMWRSERRKRGRETRLRATGSPPLWAATCAGPQGSSARSATLTGSTP